MCRITAARSGTSIRQTLVFPEGLSEENRRKFARVFPRTWERNQTEHKKTARRNNNHPSFAIPASFVSPLNRVAASVAED